MKRLFILVALVGLIAAGNPADSAHYEVQKIGNGIFAAIALPGSKAPSNALIIVESSGVILAGAHFSAEGVAELVAEIGKLTPVPVRYVILSHHHKGNNYLDFDLPSGAEVITSWQTWQALKGEYREYVNPVAFFEGIMTLRRGKRTIVVNNTGAGHTEGDVIVYLPTEGILFTSDLVFNGSVGYMGDGNMLGWVGTLELMEAMEPVTVVPGLGKVTDGDGVRRFRNFFQEFMTEVLRHLEKGDSLQQTKRSFSLPHYENLPGYRTNFDANLTRAYSDLQKVVPRQEHRN